MSSKFDDNRSPDALTIASQAVLVGLLKQLAQASPTLRYAVLESLKAADIGLRSLSDEQADPCQKDILVKAALIVQDMECTIFNSLADENGKSRR